MSRRIVVTGAGGQVGSALRTKLRGARFLTHAQMDVTDAGAVRAALAGADVVIHLAAMTHVDECERSPQLATAVNAEGTANIAAGARIAGARVIYLSTDYVFDGAGNGEYREDARPSPINEYGRTKLAGEEHVSTHADNLVVRTSWVYGQGRNFIATILAAAQRGDPLRVVDDQTGRPTWAQDLAAALATLLENEISGVLHVTGDGPACTWADLAERVVAIAGLSVPVERIDSDMYRKNSGRVVASRPPNSMLSLERARHLRVPLADWRESVRCYVETLQ